MVDMNILNENILPRRPIIDETPTLSAHSKATHAHIQSSVLFCRDVSSPTSSESLSSSNPYNAELFVFEPWRSKGFLI